VNGILKRLGTDYLDILLLHRPDPLANPAEVAAAFDALHRSGKVRFFGVSNHGAAQIALLKRCLGDTPIVANQLELNLVHNALVDQGVGVNQRAELFDTTGALELCRLHDFTVQAWAPLAKGFLTGRPIPADHPLSARLGDAARAIAKMAERKGTKPESIAIAWLLRHPAGIQPIVGTTDPGRIAAACAADQVELSYEEWYELFIAGRGGALP
jgi:predicted oxidoreductase